VIGVRTRLVLAAATLAPLTAVLSAELTRGEGGPAYLGRVALAAVLAGLAAALVAAAVTTRWLTRPLGELAGAARAIASGDNGARASTERGRELAELAGVLNTLASDRTRSVGELVAERDLLAGILDGMSEGVLVLGADGLVVLANPALRSMTLAGADAIGKQAIEAIRSAPLQEALDVASKSSRRDPVVREIELGGPVPRRLLVRVSKMAPVSSARAARRRAGERAAGLIAVFHDVTELRRLETVRTDFVANVSHELRTPVTAISTAAETLMGGALDDPTEAREFVDVVDRHAKRLRHLLDDLLDLSKIESKSFRLRLAEIEVSPLVAQSLRMIEDQARRRQVEVTVVQDADVPRVRVDRRALEQVLFNLLDNALKYAGPGTRVTIGIRRRGPDLELRVGDTGQGISPAHLGRIFERFYRVDAGRSRDLGGTGLGLSIVKHLVEAMSGSISVESEPGRGATFTILLPGVGLSHA
jgi:two-component system, OmpR family, phosphate regulon sensor histidine kinase PhoR